MYYKKALVWFVVFWVIGTIFLPSLTYIRDPYNLFHKNNKDTMYKDLRVSDYAIIRDEKFDSLILGSSLLENTSGIEAERKLGGKWANLSFSGLRSFERFKIINHAEKYHDLKNVIVSLDEHSFVSKAFENNFEPLLYDEDDGVKWLIYFTDKALSCIFIPKKCDYVEKNLDSPNAWKDNENHFRRFGGFANWIKFHEDSQIQDAFNTLLNNNPTCWLDKQYYAKAVDDEIIPLFANNNTQFHLIIPPYSALYLAHDLKIFDCQMAPYKYLIEQSQRFNNVHIYWLYDEDFVFDIANYKDLRHYHHKINSMMLDSIKEHTHIINTDNYLQKIQLLKKRLQKVNVQYYIDQIKKLKI